MTSENTFHAIFSTRHLTNWAEGMASYEVQWTEEKAVVQVDWLFCC